MVKIESEPFVNRLSRLFACWDSVFGPEVCATSLVSGKGEGSSQERTGAIHLWLFGYEFPDTLMSFKKQGKVFSILGAAKKVNHLKGLSESWTKKSGSMRLISRSAEASPAADFEKYLKATGVVKGDNGEEAFTELLGILSDEQQPVGGFVESFPGELKKAIGNEKRLKDVTDGFASLLAVKDGKEIEAINKAGLVACSIFRDVLVNSIEDTLDNEVEKSHEEIALLGEKSIDLPKMQTKWKERSGVEKDDVDLVFSCVQSGGVYVLKVSAPPSKEALCLSAGGVIVGCGIKYKEYCAGLVRTLLINPTTEQKEVYALTLLAMDAVLKSLVPGALFSDVYAAGRKTIAKSKRANLVGNFVKSVGAVVGLEFRDAKLILNAKSSAVVLPGMTFTVQVGLSGLVEKSTRTDYATWLLDTVVVPLIAQGGKIPAEGVEQDKFLSDCLKVTKEDIASKFPPNPLVQSTGSQRRTLQANSYEIADEDDDGSEEDDKRSTPEKRKKGDTNHAASSRGSPASTQKGGSTTKDAKQRSSSKKKHSSASSAQDVLLRDRLRARKGVINEADEKKLNEKQKMLRKNKTEEMRKNLTASDENATSKQKDVTAPKLSSLTSYTEVSQYPRETSLKPNKLVVDSVRESVLVPIGGVRVPFHISTLKNVSCASEDRNRVALRMNFHVPGSTGFSSKGDDNPLPELTDPKSLFVKELVYRSEDERSANEILRRLKELIKKVKAKQNLENEKRDLVEQATLQVNKTGRKPVLKELMIRPNISGSKKIIGNVEAHLNGLRFSAARASEAVDIIYSNIKHMIFQPAERELIVLIHFHLHNPIMVGKKKTHDVQFFRESGPQADDLDMRRGRSNYDPDEIAEEEREQRQRKDLNERFARFAKEVEALVDKEFDAPYRDLAFSGVPNKSNVLIYPTVNCLVHLIEWPPFILSLEEISIVSFERVMHGLRNFDMVFVFEDFSKPIKKIDNIPTENLETLKKWLNELDIVWYEGKQNLNWMNILKTIQGDVEDFITQGGFEMFLGDESEDNADSESEEEYSEGDEEEEDDDEEFDEDSDEESLAEESSDESFQELDSDEEEGLDWDELEENAAKEDRLKRKLEDDNSKETTAKGRKQR